MTIKIGLFGCFGKMGRALLQLSREDINFHIFAAAARKRKGELTIEELNYLEDVHYVSLLEELFKKSDVVIEFTSPQGMQEALWAAQQFKVPLVSGTTGHNNFAFLEEVSKKVALLWAPNMSTGINLLLYCIRQLASYAGSNYSVGITDIHHKAKKDTPSGTAIFLKNYIEEAFGLTEIPIASLRVGEVIGEHTVILAGHKEKIILAHQAESRMVFAEGAVKAAKWLVEQAPGLYSMVDCVCPKTV